MWLVEEYTRAIYGERFMLIVDRAVGLAAVMVEESLERIVPYHTSDFVGDFQICCDFPQYFKKAMRESKCRINA
eukprot:scaffold5819_cov148-Skeletonema_menzelii.AAC.17